MTSPEQTTFYSEHLGSIADGQFSRCLGRLGLGSFRAARPTGMGVSGQTLFLSSSQGEWVFRGKPHFPGQFERERCFTDLLHSHTSAPVPWPYRVDSTSDIFGWPYVVMPVMPGRQFGSHELQQSLSPGDWQGVADACGTMLAELHRLEWPPWPEHPFPFPVTVATKDFDATTYAHWYLNQLHEAIALGSGMPTVMAVADARWIQDIISENRHALEVPFRPCFLMEDFKDGNLTVDVVGGVWKVTGVFDYMFAQFGDGETDLSRSLSSFLGRDPELARVFIAAYRRGKPLREGFRERYRIYLLKDRLSMLIYSRKQNFSWFPADKRARELFEPMLSQDLFV
jgi:hygromycin-B 7''-O-kinase